MPRSTTCVTFSGPNRLMATTLRQKSGAVSRKFTARSHPALLTRKGPGPKGGSKALAPAAPRLLVVNSALVGFSPPAARLDRAGDARSRRDIHVQDPDRAALLRQATGGRCADAVG